MIKEFLENDFLGKEKEVESRAKTIFSTKNSLRTNENISSDFHPHPHTHARLRTQRMEEKIDLSLFME